MSKNLIASNVGVTIPSTLGFLSILALSVFSVETRAGCEETANVLQLTHNVAFSRTSQAKYRGIPR